MSWEPVKMALRLGRERQVSTGARLTLIYLANLWNERMHVAWPSLARLAEEVGCSERSIQRYVEELEQEYLIIAYGKGGRRPGGYGLTHIYRLLFLEGDTTTKTTQNPDNLSDNHDNLSDNHDKMSPQQIGNDDKLARDLPIDLPNDLPIDRPIAPARDQQSDVAPGGDERYTTRKMAVKA